MGLSPSPFLLCCDWLVPVVLPESFLCEVTDFLDLPVVVLFCFLLLFPVVSRSLI